MPAHEYGCPIFNVLQEDTEGGRYPKGESMIVDRRKNDRWLIFGYLVVEFIIRSFVVVPLARLAEDKKIYISVIYY